MEESRDGHFLGTQATPDFRSPLQDEGFEAGFDEVIAQDQPIMATANDDGIVIAHISSFGMGKSARRIQKVERWGIHFLMGKDSKKY
jgi:hypothetical protein